APRQRYWRANRTRASDYAESYKNGVHMSGRKEGQELSEGEKGEIRGYFRCLSDQAGHYKYNKARKAGASKDEAAEYSRIIGKGGEYIL
ncbi:MAG: hypothetical protein IJW96_01205, partial [Clostridia bacterium]|nr:hypothetical protein [Clostridia bacterium]